MLLLRSFTKRNTIATSYCLIFEKSELALCQIRHHVAGGWYVYFIVDVCALNQGLQVESTKYVDDEGCCYIPAVPYCEGVYL